MAWYHGHRGPIIRGIRRPRRYTVTVNDTAVQSRYECASLALHCRTMGDFFRKAADEICERLEIEE